MSKMKKMLTAMVAVVMLFSVASINVGAYSLRYAFGAPSNVQVLSATESVRSDGAGRISIKSSSFSTTIYGAYIRTIGNSDATATTAPQNINSTGTYYLDYPGGVAPKKNIRVTVSYSLQNYTVSKGVSASGYIISC